MRPVLVNVTTPLRYSKTLRRSRCEGAFAAFDDRELEAIALMLTMARVEFYYRYASHGEDTAWIEAAFVKIALHGRGFCG